MLEKYLSFNIGSFQVLKKAISFGGLICNDYQQKPRAVTETRLSIPPNSCLLTRTIICGCFYSYIQRRAEDTDN